MNALVLNKVKLGKEDFPFLAKLSRPFAILLVASREFRFASLSSKPSKS